MSDNICKAIWTVFKNFMNNYFNTVRLTDMAIRSIKQISKQADIGQAYVNWMRIKGEEVDESIIEKTKEEAEFAIIEVEKGFPTLNGQSLVLIWGNFEALVEDLIAICLENDPCLTKTETIQKIKIPLSQFEEMTSIERKYILLDIIQRDL